MFLLDTNTLTWKRFFVFDQPTARDMHTFTKLGSKDYYIYGGNISPENLLLDELWRLSLDSVPFNSKQPELTGALWEKIPYHQGKSASTKLPGKLRGH